MWENVLRTLRRLLRNLLIRLPGSVGETVFLPRARLLYDRLPLLDWRTKRYARSEAKRLVSAISKGVDEFTIVYDTEISGLAFGSVVNFVALAKFLNANNLKTNLLFVETSSISEDPSHDQVEIDQFLNTSVLYAQETLRNDITEVRIISVRQLRSIILQLSQIHLLFEDFTIHRRPFFRDCFNVFNQLMAKADPRIQDLSLYSPSDLSRLLPQAFHGKQYVTWACRYSARGTDFGRQTMETEFVQIYGYLRKRFPHCEIVVVSDSVGCVHYASLAKKRGIDDLRFSKEYFTDFTGDAALVLNSQFFFCFRAGGIGQVALLSKMPFEMMSPLMNEIPWNREQLTAWQTKAQTFVILKKHQFEDNREMDLYKLGFQQRTDRSGIG